MSDEKIDAIIVGSGAGGGTAARVLTDRGWNVVVLEKGKPWHADDFLPFDELHFREHKALIPKVDTDPMTYAGLDDKQSAPSERWWEIEMVGGSTMVWDANFPRYADEDMAITQYLDVASIPNNEVIDMPDWPWSYDDMQPWFEIAEHEWIVSGRSGQTVGKKGAKPWSQERMRPGYDYPQPPLIDHASTKFLMSTFEKAGMPAYRGPRAINSRTIDGRPACSFCGYDQFFACPVNSRSNSMNTMLAHALHTGRCDLRTEHCVTRVGFENGKVTGVYYLTEPNGKEQFLSAPRVFLSAQPIQSARLMLLSNVPDPHKVVGHWLTYHPKANIDFIFKRMKSWDTKSAGASHNNVGTLQLRDLYIINDKKNKKPFARDKKTYLTKGGKFSVYDPYTCIPPLRNLKGAAMGKAKTSVWGRDLVDYMSELRSNAAVTFSFTGDAMSVYDNRVEIDPARKDSWGIPVARTFYHHHQYDRDLTQYAVDRISDVMINIGHGELRKAETQAEANPGYGHVHGCLRAGTDPAKSVLDPMCQSWEVKNLYVLDASFMPTAGASNPSITMIANAYRVCRNVQ